MKYNGHKNWNHWNVALWLFNDEFFYTTMKRALRTRTKDEVAEYLLGILGEETPDGAPYSKTSIRAALVGDI